MIGGQLPDDPPLVQRQFPLAARFIDATQLEVGLDVRRMALETAQAEAERALGVAALAVGRGQLHERGGLRVRCDLGAQFL